MREEWEGLSVTPAGRRAVGCGCESTWSSFAAAVVVVLAAREGLSVDARADVVVGGWTAVVAAIACSAAAERRAR